MLHSLQMAWVMILFAMLKAASIGTALNLNWFVEVRVSWCSYVNGLICCAPCCLLPFMLYCSLLKAASVGACHDLAWLDDGRAAWHGSCPLEKFEILEPIVIHSKVRKTTAVVWDEFWHALTDGWWRSVYFARAYAWLRLPGALGQLDGDATSSMDLSGVGRLLRCACTGTFLETLRLAFGCTCTTD